MNTTTSMPPIPVELQRTKAEVKQPVPAKKPSKLKAIHPKAAEPSKPKMLIFGKPGVKKTWESLEFPSAYYVDAEGGADLKAYTDRLEKSGGVYFGIEQGSNEFSNVMDQIKALATEDHTYKTLVIDSITKIYNNAIAREQERLGDKDQFGASKKLAVSQMRQLSSWLVRLDMNVILISHERDLWGKDDKGTQTVIGQTFDSWDKLEYELHLCLQIVREGDTSRARVQKTRLPGFERGAFFPWSYPEFANRYGREVMEKKATQLILASEDQLKELNTLLEVVKLPDGTTTKWLEAASVTSFDEMDADKIIKSINYLKELIKKGAN